MIYTLTINPSIDYIMGVKEFREGNLNRTEYEKILPGGKGINVSYVLKNLGVENCALGFVGGFTGQKIENMLENSGVKTDFIHLKNGFSRINVKIKSKEETEINGKGSFIKEEEIKLLTDKIKELKDGDIIVLAGSIPGNFEKDFYSNIISGFYSKDIKVIVDAEKEILVNTLPHKPFLIKPNNFELQDIFKTEIKSKIEMKEYALKLREMGARNVFFSLGKDGGILAAENEKVYYCPAPEGKLVNSTGAGDSVVAGFIEEFENSGDYEKSFVRGICTGSASAFSEELATKEEVNKLVEQIKGKVEYMK